MTLLMLVCFCTISTIRASKQQVCGITVFFNPIRYAMRVSNFYHSRQWSLRQGLPLLVVELAFGDAPFELERHENDNIASFLRLRTAKENVMWQKEALLNIGLGRLNELFPLCTKVVWLDADVILEDGWIDAVDVMLDHAPIGQTFTHLVRLPKGVFAPWSYWSEPRMERMGYGNREGQVQYSSAVKPGQGHSGYAWAARLELLIDVGGLYDRAIVGGFDALLYHTLMDPRCETRFNARMAHHYEGWSERFVKVFSSGIGHPTAIIKAATFWHGDVKDRNYQDRHVILLENSFSPLDDVSTDENGVLQWTSSAKCSLKQSVLAMFASRQEDGIVTSVAPTSTNECSKMEL
jgi:hypothetical protein